MKNLLKLKKFNYKGVLHIMAEKKKVEREFVSASTGEKSSKPAVVSAANKGSATTKRILSVILWVVALATEVGAILILNQTWYFDNEKTRLYWLIGLIVADLILVVVGAQFWKSANRLDPASEKSKVKFFLWNQMGLIAAIICFLPLIILLLTNKNLDGKSKKIVTIVAAIALVIAALLSIDFSPVSAEDLAEAQQNAAAVSDGTAYWTRFGKSYHLNPDCQTLQNSEVVYQGTIEEAFAANRTDPCDFCALTEVEG